jgi:hypothetical protein
MVSVQFWSVPASQYRTGPKPCAAAGRAKAARTANITSTAKNVLVLIFIGLRIPLIDSELNRMLRAMLLLIVWYWLKRSPLVGG